LIWVKRQRHRHPAGKNPQKLFRSLFKQCYHDFNSGYSTLISMPLLPTEQVPISRSDITDTLNTLKRLFLTYHPERISHLYLINIIEILFQSSRTRICLFREPEHSNSVTTLKQQLMFTTFRNRDYEQKLCSLLAERLQEHGKKWLEQHTLTLTSPSGKYPLTFFLVRLEPDHSQLLLEREYSHVCYAQLHALFEKLRHEEPYVHERLHTCFNTIQPVARYHTTTIPATSDTTSPPKDTLWFGHFQDYMLGHVFEWVAHIYAELQDVPLLQFENAPAADNHFNNLFFFMRMNAGSPSRSPEAPQVDSDQHPSYFVRLLCPEQQRQELSRYFHFQRYHHCPWYAGHGQCKAHGIGLCQFESLWNTLDEQETDADRINAHYAPAWKALTKSSSGRQTLAGSAFRNCTMTFERKSTLVGAGHQWSQNPDNRADKLFSCIKHRTLPPDFAQGTNESSRPKMIFIPLYGTPAPFVIVGMVMNAAIPDNLQQALNRWQRTYRFAEMVQRFIAGRFRERIRKAYLGLAADRVQQAFESCRQQYAASLSNGAVYFLESVNHDLDMLAKIYPLARLYLQPKTNCVIKCERRDCFNAPDYGCYSVSSEPNPYWEHCIDRHFLDATEVSRKFHSAIARVLAKDEKEAIDWSRFQLWHKNRFDTLPPTKPIGSNWRDMAKDLGWDGT